MLFAHPPLQIPAAIKVLIDAVAANAVEVLLTKPGPTAAQIGELGLSVG
jgi:hypothetical protein